jgi:hypothetical protein
VAQILIGDNLLIHGVIRLVLHLIHGMMKPHISIELRKEIMEII